MKHDTFHGALSSALAVLAGLAVLATAPAMATNHVVHVTLSAPDGGFEMRMLLDHDQVPAGAVTCMLTNESATRAHAMLIVKVPVANANLPCDPDADQVEEGIVDALGRVPTLEPGASDSVTVDLPVGDYVLFSNLPGDYNGGMEAPLTVR